MKKPASQIKLGDTIILAGAKMKVTAVEHSDIGKQGAKKSRIEAQNDKGEKTVLIRPAEYPIEVQ
jgi:translation elongation factor P/translation initiation factor 5A